MTESYKIAIVGAGPAGLAAAAQAAALGLPHVLLEASAQIADTVFRFPKGKPVMSEPAQLPLRSALGFAGGTRESVLDGWRDGIAGKGVNLKTGAAVAAIDGHGGDFRISLAGGETLRAERVVVAIGVQGNIRKLGVPGENLPRVQYELDDPDRYIGETIVVVGGGDAGVENALALAPRNRVILLNRQDEFTNCRESNFVRLREALAAGRIETLVGTSVLRVDAGDELPLSLEALTPDGRERIECDRIIARLGATPPRALLESFGVRFPNDDPAAVPQLSEQYESNVAGLHIVGALTGYPLIKQALNQGFEVVEHIAGHVVEAADQALLTEKFLRIPGLTSVAEGVELLRTRLPLLASLTTLQLREFMLDSDVLVPRPGEAIFKRDDYGNSFFSVLRGSVAVELPGQEGGSARFELGSGEFFGEIGLLSGRRRSGTVVAGAGCVLVETPRRSMLKLLDSAPAVQRKLDEVALKRVVRNCFSGALTEEQIEHLVHSASPKRYGVGDVLFREGDIADGLYMIRRGSVTISRNVGGKELVAAYVSAGCYVGEMALVSKMPRTATVRAAAPTEAVVLDAVRFNAVLDQNASMRGEIASRYLERVRATEMTAAGRSSEFVQFLMNQGVGEATDVLLIDNSRCIRCNNCETACADVHDGASRLSRDAGHSRDMLHIPASCRHCEHPRCMKDCPPDAIRRSTTGEVYINDSCIGCGNCQNNCPYGVIRMVSKTEYRRPGLLSLILGMGKAPAPAAPDDVAQKKAVKCDMCMEIIGGAACVRACPTGAAFRVSPEQFFAMAGEACRI